MPHEEDKLSTAGGQPVDNDEFMVAARAEMKLRMTRWEFEPMAGQKPRSAGRVDDAFLKHFDQHITPDLEAMSRAYAAFVRLDMVDYADALDSLLGYAWRRAAYMLDDEHLETLQDWIAEALARDIGEV